MNEGRDGWRGGFMRDGWIEAGRHKDLLLFLYIG